MRSLPLITSVVVTIIGAVVATVTTGMDGALGALAGGVVVVAFLGSTPLLLKPVVRASTTFSPVAALGFFTVKAVAVVALLVLLFDVGGHVGPGRPNVTRTHRDGSVPCLDRSADGGFPAGPHAHVRPGWQRLR